MKKISKKAVLLFAILVFLFSIGIEKVEATCPSGYTEYSTSGVYTYNSGTSVFTCNITIVYCCLWDNNLKQIVSEEK